jgi:hypothetical protein
MPRERPVYGGYKVYDANGNKRCTRCEQYLSKDCFSKSGRANQLKSACKACLDEKRKKPYTDKISLSYNQLWSIKTKYNLSVEAYTSLWQKQKGRCFICQRHESEFNRTFAVDHDHACCSGNSSCGKCVRGLLCAGCNTLLGHYEAEGFNLERMLLYLKNPPYGN